MMTCLKRWVVLGLACLCLAWSPALVLAEDEKCVEACEEAERQCLEACDSDDESCQDACSEGAVVCLEECSD
jgi:hypothetical protein